MSLMRGVTLKGLHTSAIIAGFYAWVFLPSAWLPGWLGPVVLIEIGIAARALVLASRRERQHAEARRREACSARLAEGTESRRHADRWSRALPRRRTRSLVAVTGTKPGAHVVLYRARHNATGLTKLLVGLARVWHRVFPPPLHAPRIGALMLPAKRPADWN